MSLDRSVVGLLVEMRHERPHTYGQSNMRRETNVLVRRSSLQPGGGLGLFSAWCLLRLAVTRGALNPPRCDDARDPVQYLLPQPCRTTRTGSEVHRLCGPRHGGARLQAGRLQDRPTRVSGHRSRRAVHTGWIRRLRRVYRGGRTIYQRRASNDPPTESRRACRWGLITHRGWGRTRRCFVS
jgi:hypothetical protein